MYGFENKPSNQTLSEHISPRLTWSRCVFASVNNLFPDANMLMVLALESSCDGLVTKCAVIMQAHSGEDQRNFMQLETPSQFMGNMSFTFVPSVRFDEERPRRRRTKSSICYGKTCVLRCTMWLRKRLTNASSYGSNTKCSGPLGMFI